VGDGPVETAEILARARSGDAAAAQAVFDRLYDDLRRIAGALFRSQRKDHTLEATAVVHEAYLKMVGSGSPRSWQDRAHALAVGARAMRQVLANHARDRAAAKRGGAVARDRVTVSGLAQVDGDRSVDAAALHEALDRLAALDERQGRIAEMRLLGGLSVDEVAVLLGVSPRTVELDWRMAKQTLSRWLAPPEDGPAP
jgi:RNA polymerase sigma factor (TIGR02999 family)